MKVQERKPNMKRIKNPIQLTEKRVREIARKEILKREMERITNIEKVNSLAKEMEGKFNNL